MVGKTILHYKILEKIGEGGMGVVYKAEDTKLERTVAIKFLPRQIAVNSEERERFKIEAKAAASLNHPNIATIYAIEEVEDDTFIVMEYIKGQELKDIVGAHRVATIPIEDVLNYATQIAEGLQAAHEKDVTHRDIKSSNIMITEKGQVKIMDFGLAKVRGGAQVTKMGTTLGTAAYMSPEQAQGLKTDHRTDIWAFGVVLYEMLTGKMPFPGDYEQAVIYSILNEEPLRISELRPEIPESVVQITNRLLAKTADDRYQNIDEALGDLQAVENELKHGPALRDQETVLFFKDLYQRRVPQILLLYFGASFGIIKIVQALVQHYAFSPHLSDLTFVALLSLIPTIFLLAYFHGKGGDGRWTGIEKLGIPLNLVVSAALLIIVFQDKDLGAITKTVSMRDEAGRIMERVIPKSEFRRKVAIFFFDNKSGDSKLDWLQYGLTFMLEYDLSQDLFIDAREETDFYYKVKKRGFVSGLDLPLTLKLKIANDLHLNYLLSGSFEKQEDDFVVNTSLYETKLGKVVKENTFRGPNVFKLADEISLQLKLDLEIPAQHIEDVKDLPVSEIITNSFPAFRAFVNGYKEFVLNNDHATAAQFLEQAVQEDPAFAVSHLFLFVVYANSNQTEKTKGPLETIMQYIYKFPEKYQFSIKAMYYLVNEQVEKRLAVLKMWTELYPEDIDAHTQLANYYINANQLEAGISELEKILEIDPGQYRYLHSIGDIYVQREDYEQALAFYLRYADEFPGEAISFEKIGDFHQVRGNHEQAKANYEKAQVIDPDDVSTMLSIADIDRNLGNFDRAVKQFESALEHCKTPNQRASVLDSFEDYYELRGQINKAIEYLERKWDEQQEYAQPLNFMIQKLFSLGLYVEAGKKDAALKTIRELHIYPPFDKLKSVGNMLLYLEAEDFEGIEKTVEGAEQAIQALGFEQMRAMIYAGQGAIHASKAEYRQAIELYEKALAIRPRQHDGRIALGRCYRNLKEFPKAREAIELVLTVVPVHPEANYELALVYNDMGDNRTALDHLNKALSVWENADPGYKPARKAREKLAEWESKEVL